MRELLELLSGLDDGLIFTSDFARAGVHPRDIEAALVRGMLVRVRRGAYVSSDIWNSAWPVQRHQWLVRATVALSPRPLVVSHLSALAMHELPTIGDWPDTVHTLESGASGGKNARFITGHRGGADADTVVVDGVTVTTLERTLIDVAATESMMRAVAPLDAALHRGLSRDGTAAPGALTKERLLEELEKVAPKRGQRRAEAAIAFADGLAESPGESLSRVRIFELGFEVPELQIAFDNIRGRTAIVDFYWRRIRKAGEFDGMSKYLRGAIVRDGEDPGLIVVEEKLREDALRRRAVDSVARWIWDEAISAATFRRFLLENDVPLARR